MVRREKKSVGVLLALMVVGSKPRGGVAATGLSDSPRDGVSPCRLEAGERGESGMVRAVFGDTGADAGDVGTLLPSRSGVRAKGVLVEPTPRLAKGVLANVLVSGEALVD
jgi:hypothetical protein